MNYRLSGNLQRLYMDPTFTDGWQPQVVKAFRKLIGAIEAAVDERDLRVLGGGKRFEKLKGDRQHQYSMRLNDQFRLILEFEGAGSQKVVVIVGIEDYH